MGAIILILLSTLSGFAANKYIDAAATGANNGSSWSDAWTNVTAVTWASVSPGDTVYIAGGHYVGQLAVGTDGTAANPITIRASQEAGKNSLVIISNFSASAVAMRDYVTLNGSKDDAYEAWMTNAYNVPHVVSNNCGIKLLGVNGVNYTRSGPAGVRVYWCEIQSVADGDSYTGVRFAPGSESVATNTEVAYCWIHDTGQDAVNNAVDTTMPGWGRYTAHHNLIERTGDDGFEIGPAWTIHHNVMRDTRKVRGHPDAIQSVGNYQRFYNNIILDFNSSHILTQGKTTNYGPVQIYGNLMYVDDLAISSAMVELKWFPIETYTFENTWWSDWVFANNTLVNAQNGGLALSKREFCTNVFLTNIVVKNNLFLRCTNNAAIVHNGDDGLTGGLWTWVEAGVAFERNIVTGPGALGFRYDEIYATAEAMNDATIYDYNSSSTPTFDSGTYRPSSIDTVAKSTGESLASLSLPGFDTDLSGLPRGENWDRGALVASGSYSPAPAPVITNRTARVGTLIKR